MAFERRWSYPVPAVRRLLAFAMLLSTAVAVAADAPSSGPRLKFDAPLSVFEAALENERKVTHAINSLYALAQQEQDYPSQVLLQWFITEQVEEEKTAQQAIDQLKMAGSDASALLMLDQQFGQRPTAAMGG